MIPRWTTIGFFILFLTLAQLLSCNLFNEKCADPNCEGNNGKCLTCSSGSVCSKTYRAGCSAAVSGVYCCSPSAGGGTAYCNPGYTYNFSSGKCCPNSTPYYYPGTHGIKAAGCYASCPYVGDCGTRWQKF